MPDIYIPSQELYEKISSLVQGFYLEVNRDKEVVLLMKYEASVTSSLMQGCNIDLVVRNPKLSKRTTTIYIHDHPESPLYTTGECFSIESENFEGFDEVIIEFLKAENIRIVYFNEMNLPFFTAKVRKENLYDEFLVWLQSINDNPTIFERVINGNFSPENNIKGFSVKILNENFSKADTLKIYPMDHLEEWGDDAINKDSYYDFKNFTSDGKHGYNQELSIRANLQRYFKPNNELFHSPLKIDDTELSDFLIEYEKAVIIIESKYILSDTQRQLNKMLLKGVNQLNKAEEIIINSIEILKDSSLKERLSHCEVILKICLHNDNIILNRHNTRNIVANFNKEDLPIFISVATFSQFLGTVKLLNEEHYKYNIIQNLLNIYGGFLNSFDDILILREIN